MVIGKKKRDVKFIIYQSLYILVIAMLGAKHVTINDIPDALKQGDTIIAKANLDSINRLMDSLKTLPTYDKGKQIVLKKLENDSINYQIVSLKETIISIKELNDLKKGQVKPPPANTGKVIPPTNDPGVLTPDQ